MRFTVIGGFLGAGKTTLLNRILVSDYARDSVVLVNDFGSISIDSRLVTARSSRLITLANGCICCSMGNAFVTALIEIARRPVLPQRLIVEASGVADPAKIAEFAATDLRFTLETVPVVVDAVSFPAQKDDRRIGELVQRQLAAADVIVLNKVDLIDESEAQDLAGWLGSHFPRQPVIAARHAEVPFAALFDNDAPVRPTPQASVGDAAPVNETCFESFVFETGRPFDRARLAWTIGQLPPGVLRGKGLVWVNEDEKCLRVFQMAGSRWSLESAPDALHDQPRSQLILIGLRGCLKQDELHCLFSAALAPQMASRHDLGR